MVTEDDVQRARLVTAVREAIAFLAPAVDGTLRVALPDEAAGQPAGADEDAERLALLPARIDGLATSLAWHERRRVPEHRLDVLRGEIARLAEKVRPESDAAIVYGFLRETLGLAGAPGSYEAEVLRDLRMSPSQREHWTGQARLLLAQTAMQLMQMLATGEVVRRELEARGGAIRLEPE